MKKLTVLSRGRLWWAAIGLIALANAPLPAVEKANIPPADEPLAEEPAANANTQETDHAAEHRAGPNREAVVVFGRDAVLKKGETAEAVVVIGGSARVEGKVRAAVVTIGGDADISGEVGDAAVAVMGSVKLAPTAKVRGDAVSVGGSVDVAEGASVGGHTQEVNFGGWQLPKLHWLQQWLRECVFKGRPLAPSVGWLWIVTGVYLLVYLLVAVAFPGAVQSCVQRLTEQPATTFLTGLLTKLLVPFVLGLLLITGIGIIGVPFLVAAVVLAKVFGKVALFMYLGQQLARAVKPEAALKPLLALLLGWLLITLLYMVWYLGFFTMILVDIWALGVAVMAVVSRSRRETPPASALPPPPAAPVPSSAPAPPVAPSANYASLAGPAAGAGAGPAPTPPPMPATATVPPGGSPPVPPTISPAAPPVYPPEALAYPRAGFWQRIGAGVLDLLLIGIAVRLMPFRHGDLPFLLISVAYFTALWTWKGTTVGGIVLNLKVARLDGQPVTWAVALVRALFAWFSAVVLFLGFFWIAWDKELQGWHDKIAGTVVVRLPRGTPLLLL